MNMSKSKAPKTREVELTFEDVEQAFYRLQELEDLLEDGMSLKASERAEMNRLRSMLTQLMDAGMIELKDGQLIFPDIPESIPDASQLSSSQSSAANPSDTSRDFLYQGVAGDGFVRSKHKASPVSQNSTTSNNHNSAMNNVNNVTSKKSLSPASFVEDALTLSPVSDHERGKMNEDSNRSKNRHDDFDDHDNHYSKNYTNNKNSTIAAYPHRNTPYTNTYNNSSYFNINNDDITNNNANYTQNKDHSTVAVNRALKPSLKSSLKKTVKKSCASPSARFDVAESGGVKVTESWTEVKAPKKKLKAKPKAVEGGPVYISMEEIAKVALEREQELEKQRQERTIEVGENCENTLFDATKVASQVATTKRGFHAPAELIPRESLGRTVVDTLSVFKGTTYTVGEERESAVSQSLPLPQPSIHGVGLPDYVTVVDGPEVNDVFLLISPPSNLHTAASTTVPDTNVMHPRSSVTTASMSEAGWHSADNDECTDSDTSSYRAKADYFTKYYHSRSFGKGPLRQRDSALSNQTEEWVDGGGVRFSPAVPQDKPETGKPIQRRQTGFFSGVPLYALMDLEGFADKPFDPSTTNLNLDMLLEQDGSVAETPRGVGTGHQTPCHGVMSPNVAFSALRGRNSSSGSTKINLATASSIKAYSKHSQNNHINKHSSPKSKSASPIAGKVSLPLNAIHHAQTSTMDGHNKKEHDRDEEEEEISAFRSQPAAPPFYGVFAVTLPPWAETFFTSMHANNNQNRASPQNLISAKNNTVPFIDGPLMSGERLALFKLGERGLSLWEVITEDNSPALRPLVHVPFETLHKVYVGSIVVVRKNLSHHHHHQHQQNQSDEAAIALALRLSPNNDLISLRLCGIHPHRVTLHEQRGEALAWASAIKLSSPGSVRVSEVAGKRTWLSKKQKQQQQKLNVRRRSSINFNKTICSNNKNSFTDRELALASTLSRFFLKDIYTHAINQTQL